VALEACRFWCVFCEDDLELPDSYFAVLRDVIPQLTPVLLTNMAYAEDDEARAPACAAPATRAHTTPTGCAGCGGGGAARPAAGPSAGHQAVHASLAGARLQLSPRLRAPLTPQARAQAMGAGAAEAEEDEDEDEENAWTLRKSSASILDNQ
jgi:hypothetical protein